MRQHYPLNSAGNEDAGQLPWIDGVPSTGTQGSFPGHAIVTDTEAEVLAAIDASGQTRNGSDTTQLAQAISRGLYLGQFSGTANTLTATLPNNVVFSALQTNARFTGFVGTTNTAGVTLKINGIGSPTGGIQAPLLRRDGSALLAGDLIVGQPFEVRWDGSAYRLVGSAASETPTQSPAGKKLVSNTVAGSYTFTVPSVAGGNGFDVYWLHAIVVGAGAGGSGSTTSSPTTTSGGGGAGETRIGWLAVTPGQVINYVVGAGGAGAGYGVNSSAGGSSSVGSSITAMGGSGTGNNGGAGGAGGTGGSGGQIAEPGGNGTDGNLFTANAPGGSGGASSLGGGGRASTIASGTVTNGKAPGSGGGGVYSAQFGGNGGNGADGAVIFEY